MAYNLSRQSVIRLKPQLDLLAKAQSDVVFPSTNSERDAFAFRQAVRAARKYEEFSEYHELKDKFKFREKKDHVLAEYRGVSHGIVVPQNRVADIPNPPNRVSGVESGLDAVAGIMKKQGEKRTVISASSLIDILASLLEGDMKDVEEVYFPNAILTEGEKVKLYGWTKSDDGRGWTFIDHEDKGVTLTKKEVPNEVIWKLPLP